MPQPVLEWGLSVIAALQTLRTPLLDQFFIIVTELGDQYFYFAALPIICTMMNRKIGIRIALTIVFSVMLNSLLKHLVAEPRPFIIDPSVGLIPETDFSFPSGHTQQAALFWGLTFLYLRHFGVAVFGSIFVFLVALSRVYLGVHYPTDVLASVLLAFAILLAHEVLIQHAELLWKESKRYFTFAAAVALSLVFVVIIPTKDMIAVSGLGLGLVAGILFEKELPPLPFYFPRRFLIASITGICLLILFVGLKLLFPGKGSTNYELFSFVRYFACGITLNALPIYLGKSTKFYFAKEKEARQRQGLQP